MPKKNNAGGCGCCCGPVTEHVDEFDSLWSCFLGKPNGYDHVNPSASTDYSALNFMGQGWSVSSGQLIYSRNAGAVNQDPIIIDAVRLAVPFSMEFILEVAELNSVSGDQAVLNIQMMDGTTGTTPFIRSLLTAGIAGSLSPVATIVINGGSQTISYTNPISSLPATIWHRIQVDTDGITQWLWIDGVAPSGGSWGTKRSGTPDSLTGLRKRYWSLEVRPTPSAARANWAKFNRLEVREWDHTQISMPDPDNPF